MSGIVVGIDVGGTKLAGVALTDGGDEPLVATSRRRDGTPLVAQVVRVVDALLGDPGSRDGSLRGIGIAVPGQVDPARGAMRLAVNVDQRETALGPAIAAASRVPCFVEHDARAVAAWLCAAGHGPDLAYVSVGTGVSAGIVLGGTLLRGPDGLAGEIGHLVADGAGPRCACGLVGCLEAVASGPAIARAAGMSDAEDVFAAAAAGDARAAAVVERAATHLARALRGLALAFGVRRILVGGGVARAGAGLSEPLAAALAAERAASALVSAALPDGAISVIDDERPLGAIAAAAVARNGLAPPAGRRMEVVPP